MTWREVRLALDGRNDKIDLLDGLNAKVSYVIAVAGFNGKAAAKVVKTLYPTKKGNTELNAERIRKQREAGLKTLEKINARGSKNSSNSGRNASGKGSKRTGGNR